MLRLILLLCAALFAVMLVGGRDYGQLRPGLAALQNDPVPAQASTEPAVAPVQPLVTQASFTPEPEAQPEMPLILPLVSPAATQTEAPAPTSGGEIRYITARSVNVREGPSTEFPVVGKLTRGEAALVIWTEDNGWARILIEGDGVEGFISGEFLATAAP